MASPNQRSYIKDLAVLKLKEFKEFKEMLYANEIVDPTSQTVANADSIDAILDATTDFQASKMINALIARKEPVRSRTYSQKRSERVIDLLDKIKARVDEWDYYELQ